MRKNSWNKLTVFCLIFLRLTFNHIILYQMTFSLHFQPNPVISDAKRLPMMSASLSFVIDGRN